MVLLTFVASAVVAISYTCASSANSQWVFEELCLVTGIPITYSGQGYNYSYPSLGELGQILISAHLAQHPTQIPFSFSRDLGQVQYTIQPRLVSYSFRSAQPIIEAGYRIDSTLVETTRFVLDW